MTDKGLDDSDICTDGATTVSSDSLVDPVCFDVTQKKVLQHPLISTDQSSMEVIVPRAEYERLKQELRTKDRKLVAFDNIHLLLQEKDAEISCLKEKNKSQADALIFSEMRYSQLVRLTAKSAKDAERQNPERERCDVKTQIDGDETRVLSRNVRLVRDFEGNSNFSITCDVLLEKNRALISVDGPSKQIKRDTLDTKCSGKDIVPSGEAVFEPHRGESVSDPKTSKLTARTIGSEDENSTFERESSGKDSSAGVRPYRAPPGKGFLKDPGVSKDLVSKLIQQNARLKQVLRQVAGQHGFTIEQYMDKQEYVSVVDQLRNEIRLLQLRGKDKDEMLASVENLDVTGLIAKSLKLQETIQKQNRMLAVNEAMVEAYSNRCDELEGELKRLKTFVKSNNIADYKAGSEQGMPISEKPDTIDSSADQPHSQPALPVSGLTIDGNADGRHGGPVSTPGETEPPRNTLLTVSTTLADQHISLLVCERCEREFDVSDRDKYLEHCRKCTDD